MKKLIIISFSFFFFFENYLESMGTSSAITYIRPGGRVGDQLFCYCKAKWISYKYNIPLYYKFFKYSDELFLSLADKPYRDLEINYSVSRGQLQIRRLRGTVNQEKLNPEHWIYINSEFDDENTLYIIDQYFFPAIWKHFVFDISNVIHSYNIYYNKHYIEQGINKYKFRHDEMIMAFKQDSKFIGLLRKLIKPINKLELISKPEGIISVAVHVRIGGGFDGPHASPFFYESHPQLNHYVDFILCQDNSLYYKIQRQARDSLITKISAIEKIEKKEDVMRPLKHAPMQFYVDQIKGLSAMLKDAPLFVYIFTDQPNPSEIKKKFEELINKENIIFACRKQENRYNLNVLEDLFSMSKFDCLIRPYSSLSHIAQLIGDHKIVISPYHSIWYEGKLLIDEVQITVNDRSFVK